MTDFHTGQDQFLPAELAAALRRTSAQTLNALHSLRVALRDHVQLERSRGISLDEIDEIPWNAARRNLSQEHLQRNLWSKAAQ